MKKTREKMKDKPNAAKQARKPPRKYENKEMRRFLPSLQMPATLRRFSELERI